MKKLALGLVAAAALSVAVPAQAALVAYWNFNNLPAITTANTPANLGITSIAANTGAGTISLAGYDGNIDDFNGSTVNAISPDVAGASLSLIAGGSSAPFPGNGDPVDVTFSTTGLEDPILTFASQRTTTGFTGNTWEYSVNGGAFVAVPGAIPVVPASSYALVTLDFSTLDAVDNAASVTLRYILAGATGSSGNNRIDNLQVNATEIPEPSSLALLALGIAGVRRRR